MAALVSIERFLITSSFPWRAKLIGNITFYMIYSRRLANNVGLMHLEGLLPVTIVTQTPLNIMSPQYFRRSVSHNLLIPHWFLRKCYSR